MNLPQQIFRRASEIGLFSSCVLTPCGRRFWSFHIDADDIIYCRQFDMYRPREAVINHIPEHKALWFLDAYDRKHYDALPIKGDIESTGKWMI